MNTRTCSAGIRWLLAVLVSTGAARASGQTGSPTFEEALYLELGRSDPATAAGLYEPMTRDPQRTPAERARAQVRLAYCLEKTGRATDACEQWRLLIDRVAGADGEDLEEVLEAVAERLVRVAAGADAGLEEACIRDLMKRLQHSRPRLVERLRNRRPAARLTVEGNIHTWDGQPARPMTVRVEGRPMADLGNTDARLTEVPVWVIVPDEAGHFTCQLPPGSYEIVVTSPFYERLRKPLVLFPELEGPVAEELTLGRIEIPKEVNAVFLVGNWLDNWNRTVPLVETEEGVWEYTTLLPPGDYHYKFMISGYRRWICDVLASDFVDDGRSGFNSRLVLPESREVRFRFSEHDARLVKTVPHN